MPSAPAVAWSMALAFAAAAPAQVVLNPTIPNLLVSSCVHSGDTVHALGAGLTGSSTFTALYARSTDGGRTWPLREVQLGACNFFGGKVAASGNTVVALLRRDDGILPEVHSSDGGATWSTQRALAPWGTDFDLHVEGTTVNVFYYAFQFGVGWLWHNRSTDGGATWLATPRQLDGTNGMVSPVISPRPQCIADGADLHVFWTDTGSGASVMHQRSTDGGATWLPTPQNMGVGQAVGIVASSGVLFVGSQPPQRSIDQGTTWNPVTVTGLSSPFFGGDGANVLAAQGVVAPQGANYSVTVLANTSVDGGLTWRSQPVQALPPRSSAMIPGVELRPFVVGNAWYIDVQVWGLGLEVLLMSVDQGTTWRTVANPTDKYWPAPSRIVATLKYTWPQALAKVLAGHTIVGAGMTGSGGIEPQLHGVGIPAPGLNFTLELTHALGGSFGLLGFGVGAPVSVPFGSATLYVPSPITTLFAPTGGSAGVPGSGGFTWVQSVPNSPVFSGLQLVSQGLVWDAGAADGFAMTAGVASKLH